MGGVYLISYADTEDFLEVLWKSVISFQTLRDEKGLVLLNVGSVSDVSPSVGTIRLRLESEISLLEDLKEVGLVVILDFVLHPKED